MRATLLPLMCNLLAYGTTLPSEAMFNQYSSVPTAGRATPLITVGMFNKPDYLTLNHTSVTVDELVAKIHSMELSLAWTGVATYRAGVNTSGVWYSITRMLTRRDQVILANLWFGHCPPASAEFVAALARRRAWMSHRVSWPCCHCTCCEFCNALVQMMTCLLL